MEDWWEKNVHFTVHGPDNLRHWPFRLDTSVVAEAAIYSAQDIPRIGLYFLVTAQDLKMRNITREAVTEGATQAMAERVQEWTPQVEKQKETIQVEYNWNGQYIGKRLATG